jgi:hypothetical protein
VSRLGCSTGRPAGEADTEGSISCAEQDAGGVQQRVDVCFLAAILAGRSDVTCILSAMEHGDPHAAEQLLLLPYDELRKLAAQMLAREKPGQSF